MALKMKGHDVRYATTGADGLTQFNEFSPDLVLLDLTLPDMDGSELARQIKSSGKGKSTPILLISGRLISQSELDQSLYAGMLEKPFSISKLNTEVEKYLKKA